MGGIKGQRPGPIEALKKRKRNFDKWLYMVTRRHGVRFDYTRAADNFERQKSPEISIRCVEHDLWFSVTPFGYLQRDGGGCPICGPSGRGALRKKRNYPGPCAN